DKNVVLVTNSTLLATLRTVSHVWRLAEQQKNSQRIADRGAKLYEKFVGFIEDMDKVGRAIKSSHEAWESASNKLHQGSGNLVRQAQQLKDLGVHSDKSLRADLIEKAQNEVAPP
ncbi:MAG TPA: DNA recombination protein RmuC, partial [Methylomirabilota bacterium]|nr:DNA recombination protein RmuC [Methylomirabilota bacterium]